MDWLSTAVDFFLHLDRHLADVVGRYGTGTYALLCLILFCETGLVVTPFLPGDSLLFAAGTIAALGALDPAVLVAILAASAVLGDSTNYWIGRWVGPRAFSGNVRFLNRAYLERTHAFYEKHGGKTVFLARFAPILRTFAPFVAGVGAMGYFRFLRFSIVGSLAWVSLFVLGGYFFGNLPAVRENFSLVILAIIVISLMPAAIEAFRSWRRAGA
ncbi:MAG TPA: DedA family protein [Gemmatimonadales bacterium]|jgi:membrane-associated protein|nr:DedA family protein [Gemmatimonadales bacterium]